MAKTGAEFESYLQTCKDPSFTRDLIQSLAPELLPEDYYHETVTMTSEADIERLRKINPWTAERVLIGQTVQVRKQLVWNGPPRSQWHA